MAISEVVIASGNEDKVKELQELLRDTPIRVRHPREFGGIPEIEEDGVTLEDNARKKALTVAQRFRLPAVADDTGLFVDALGGRPGVYSARYAGEGVSYEENVRKLLAELKGVADERRTARFVCVIALSVPADGDITVKTVEGVCQGSIAHKPRGNQGFGYDPIFIVSGTDRTFAEMDPQEKNEISHRGRALAKLKALLQQELNG